MIIVMKQDAAKDDVTKIVAKIENAGLKTHLSVGEEVTVTRQSSMLTRSQPRTLFRRSFRSPKATNSQTRNSIRNRHPLQ